VARPPAGEPEHPPAVVGAVVDRRAGPDEVVATLADLARRGYVALLGAGEALRIERRRPADPALPPFERTLLAAFVRDRTPLSPDGLSRNLRPHLRAILGAIEDEAVARGLLTEPARARRRRMRLAPLLLLASLPLALLWPPAALIGVVATALALALLSRRRAGRTPAGERVAARWADPPGASTPIPYAVALGLPPEPYARIVRALAAPPMPATAVERGREEPGGRDGGEGRGGWGGAGGASGGGGASRGFDSAAAAGLGGLAAGAALGAAEGGSGEADGASDGGDGGGGDGGGE
jgi:uncharacterized protein (TIGR04222 family)